MCYSLCIPFACWKDGFKSSPIPIMFKAIIRKLEKDTAPCLCFPASLISVPGLFPPFILQTVVSFSVLSVLSAFLPSLLGFRYPPSSS